MIQIVLHRILSLVIACSDVRHWEQGDTSHGWRDKSADCRRAHVVGWVEFSRCCAKPLAGASRENIKENNALSAIPHRELVATTL